MALAHSGPEQKMFRQDFPPSPLDPPFQRVGDESFLSVRKQDPVREWRRAAHGYRDAGGSQKGSFAGASSTSLALVHDAHAVAEVTDHRQVVRDEQEREAMLPLQVLKEGHDLRLYGNVE